MALYSYKKKAFGRKRKILVFFSYTSMTIGALFLFWSFYPIVVSEFYTQIFINNNVTSPIPANTTSASVQKANSIRGRDDKFTTNLVDYTKAHNWFNVVEAEGDYGPEFLEEVDEYYVDIPKIDVEHARVSVGGDDLLNSVVHYLPRTMPGKKGKVSLFGHSSLLQLYKPDDYEHIFSHVPFLEKGDVIHVTVNGVKYTYEVFDKTVVDPDQVSVLDQQYDDAYLDLITCVPHGTYLRRAVIKAKIKEL